MERNGTRLDPIQLSRLVFDEELEANKVTIVGTEMAIAVSAQDGDSVTAVPVSATLSEGVHDVSGIKTICLYGEATVSVSADGETFHALTLSALEPKSICARHLKIEGTGLVVVQSV